MFAEGLEEFYFSAIRFNLDVYSPERGGLNNLLSSLTTYTYVGLLSLIGLCVLLTRWNRDVARNALLTGYLIIGMMSIAIMGKYHIYHFELLVPILCLLAIYSVRVLELERQQVWLAIGIVALIAYLYFPRALVSQFVRHGANKAAAETIAANTASFTGFGLSDERRVADYIDAEGVAADKVEFMLLWPGLRWRCGNASLTRFTTTYALTMNSEAGSITNYQDRWKREYDSTLFHSRPTLIVSADGPEYLAAERGMSPDSLLHSLPKSKDLLITNYHLDTVIGGFNIYRLNEAAN
jgi:hypothetical protein